MCNMSFRVRSSNYDNISCKYVKGSSIQVPAYVGSDGISQHRVKVGLVMPTIHPFGILNWKLHEIRAFCWIGIRIPWQKLYIHCRILFSLVDGVGDICTWEYYFFFSAFISATTATTNITAHPPTSRVFVVHRWIGKLLWISFELYFKVFTSIQEAVGDEEKFSNLVIVLCRSSFTNCYHQGVFFFYCFWWIYSTTCLPCGGGSKRAFLYAKHTFRKHNSQQRRY